MTILLVDDHPLFRHGVRHALERDARHQIVGEASDGVAALAMLRELRPDVCILDIAMPGIGGLDVIEQAREEQIAVEFIVLTMYEDEGYFTDAMDLDVRGYVLKDTGVAELHHALQFVVEGRTYVSPSIASYLVQRVRRMDEARAGNPSLDDLTPTEREVLRRIAANMTSRQIGAELHVSYRTVQNHRSRITAKLGLRGYNRLLQFALEHRDVL